jgi:phospholipase C
MLPSLKAAREIVSLNDALQGVVGVRPTDRFNYRRVPSMALNDIETILFLMMENRSFDHVLGYLGMTQDEPAGPIEGFRDDGAWLSDRANLWRGQSFRLHELDVNGPLIVDPPHDSAHVATQIATAAAGAGNMGGFVASYMTRSPPPAEPSSVMGYYKAGAVPMFDYLARNYAVCDHWFASLPTGTQANRLMAMRGESPILNNASWLLPEQDLAYDWLHRHSIDWCVYQSGRFLPFFALMPRWLPEIAGSLAFEPRGRFRRYSRFHEHWRSGEPIPPVIFIEPEYTDGPHTDPNDDHPPTGIAKGQAFLSDIYNTLTSNPTRWKNSLLIVAYDEHGGFFDHVPPLSIPGSPGGAPIGTTGLRVPAFLVSPHVTAGVPFNGQLDHTSFLRLLADRFDGGKPYSPAVAERQTRLAPLASALDGPAVMRRTPDAPPGPLAAAAFSQPITHPRRNGNETGDAFHEVAMKFARDHPDALARPEWSGLARYVAAPAVMAEGGGG